MATVSASFWGAFCIRQQHPTRGYRIFETMNGFEPWSTLLTPCSPDSWVLLHHRFFNDTHELKSAKLDAAFCQSFYIFLHIRKISKACSYQEFWRLFAGFLLEIPGFLPKKAIGPLACRIHLDVSQMPKASSKSNAGGTSCCPPCCGKGLPGHQSFPAFDHHQSSIKKRN